MPQTQPATDPASDFSKLIKQVSCESEAWALPTGTAVGDKWGGRTFTDNVAAVLESRSCGGWREVEEGQTRWTFIILAR
jgi:hypothetical protein